MFARILSASRRRMMVVTGVAALLVATSGIRAQQPQGQQPQQPPPAGGQPAGQQPAAQQPAQPAAPQLAFTSDAALVLFTVKSANAADFEAEMAKFKEALEKSPKPEHKQILAGWKVMKGLEGAQPGEVMYIGVIDPVVKGADYDPRKVISEVFPTEAQAMNQKFYASLAGINQLNLQAIK